MPLTEQYKVILDEWEAQLEDMEITIFQALRRAYPGGRRRRQLIFDVFGQLIPNTVDLNNNKYDRKIRLTIAAMREELIPIVSSSGEAGYRLDLSEETICKMIDEWSRRQEMYRQKVERGNRLILRIRELGERALPVQLVRSSVPKQLSWME